MNDFAVAETVEPITHAEKMAALSEVFGKDYAKEFQDPVIFTRKVFQCPAVKSFYRREFPLVSRTLFVESVYRRRYLYNQAILDDFSALTETKLEDIKRLLTMRCDQVRKMCTSNNATEDADYMHPARKVVPIIAGGARSYLTVLEKLDEVYGLVGKAILNGVIDSKQRKDVELSCRKAVRAFSGLLRTEIFKLRRESVRMHAANGQVEDADLRMAEGAHDEALQTFDAEVALEDAQNPGTAADGENAAAVIQDMVATATATAKSAARRKPTTAPAADADAAAQPAQV
jgi:hypothetical protein